MTTGNSVRKVLGSSALALAGLAGMAGLGFASAANAQDVYWSVGVGSPGVQVAVSNAPPVVHHYPRTVVVQQPVIVQPAPVYHAYPVYAPVYGPGYGHGYGHGYGYGRPVIVQRPVVVAGWHHPVHGGWHQGRHGRGYEHGRGNGHQGRQGHERH